LYGLFVRTLSLSRVLISRASATTGGSTVTTADENEEGKAVGEEKATGVKRKTEAMEPEEESGEALLPKPA